MFTATLLTLAKIRKHPKGLLVDGWIKRLLHVNINIWIVGCIQTHTQWSVIQPQKEGNPAIL